MPWESWDEHRERLAAERENAANEKLCPVEVNEWARYRSGSEMPKHKICCKKPSPDAIQIGLTLCGLHLRQHLKAEAEATELQRRRAEAKRQNELNARRQEVKDAQEKAILEELERHGVPQAELSRPWRYDRVKRGWTVAIPLSVLWKVIDVLPMLDPDEKVELWDKEQAAAAEAAKPKDAEVPF